MSVTPKAKVLGLRSRMGKSRRQIIKENTNSTYSVTGTETNGKTILSEDSEDNQCDNKNNNSSCMVTPVKARQHTEMESPDIPQSSRFIQSLLPKMFGSPEIDVSWDWSSSQITTDSGNSSADSFVPKVKHNRTKPLNRRLLRALPPAIMFRPRLPPDKCVSEEEQKKRVEFYRNLYNEIKGNIVEKESSVKESAFGSESSEMQACVERQDEKYEALFDDSNNEIMVECSQAIEEVFRVKDDVIPNLSDPSEEQSVINLHYVNTSNGKSISHEILDNRTNMSVSDRKVNSELRIPPVSKEDVLYVTNKSDSKYCQGRMRMPLYKTEFKHLRQSSRGTEDDNIRVHEYQMDVTTLFNDDNDDEFSSLAVDILPSVPDKCPIEVPDIKTKKCSQFEIEEKRKQALRKLMKKKGVSIK